MFSGSPPVHLMWSSMYNPEKQKLKRRVDWRRLGELFRPYIWQETQLTICIVATSILGLLPPLLTLSIIDKAIPKNDFNLLLIDVGLMLGSALVSGLIGVYQGYLSSFVGESIIRDLHTRLVTHLHHMPLSFFAATKTGEIMNRVSNDVEAVDSVVTMTMVAILTNVFIIITTLFAIFALDARLAALSLVLIPLMVLPLWPVGRRMYEARKRTRAKRDEMHASTQETLSVSGIVLVKSFVKEELERSRFFKLADDLMKLEVNVAMVGRWFLMAITFMITAGPAAIWLIGGFLAIKHGVTVGVLVSFVALLGRLYTPVSSLAGVQVQVVSALAVFERIFDYLDMSEERDSPNAIVLKQTDGAVKFDDVTFIYPDTNRGVRNLTFEIHPGQMVAIVGPSGAGKSTVAQLLPRLFDPDSGVILIDQHDIKSVTRASVRSHIGIVMQETYLFHDTILANLKYAKEDASEDEVIQACKAANIHDFITSLPEGYKTIVGERGHKLSGGERQRLAIARVLLKDPKILILDEATSSLDTENEAAIQSALEPLMQGRSTLVVAHRLSTIMSADCIYVVEDGSIVEQGNHQKLLAAGGAYARLYRANMS
ncbi:MAG: ABC transporter ATP-binding protein [Cyanobacteria bacterium TGS_CYA1]|nr:ABC transporter ATP-binding protein [Cyanobacteria bacterium TGS_CYA1]